ncbi:MAG: ATP cone domain-containing protein, partial [Nanoarchaeota archaeon]
MQLSETALSVIKRNGEVVAFDSEKIKNAVEKAVRAAKSEISGELLNRLIVNIIEEIKVRFVDFYPNVENIQDVVEKHLIMNNLYEIAKAYILYRDKRREEREKQQQVTLEKAHLGKLRIKKRD